MIDHLRGTILEKNEGYVLLDVNGVGYGLLISAMTHVALGDPGAQVSLWTRTYVREDILKLFGFATRGEREAFDVFITLSGVGPNTGLAILSTLTPAEIVHAALRSDPSKLCKVKGIGLKTAEKLVLELKRKADRLAVGLTTDAPSTEGAVASLTPAAQDAVEALIALDVRPAQAAKAIMLALEQLGSEATAEQLVREGLKHRR